MTKKSPSASPEFPVREFFARFPNEEACLTHIMNVRFGGLSMDCPACGVEVTYHKLSKRREEDISSLCGAFRVFVNDQGRVGMARIAFGGMAATPKRAKAVEAALVGQPWTEATVDAAVAAFAEDYQPISDMRASADYRLLTAQNLLQRFFLETTGHGQRLRREVA